MPDTYPANIELDDNLRQALLNTPSVEQEPLHDGDLPLHKAAYKGDNSQLATLIKSGASINARGVYYYTPLQLAVRGNHGETVRILLAAGADATLEDGLETHGNPPVDAVIYAAWRGAQDALEALLAFGVKLSASALRKAASLNHVECMRMILEKLGRDDFSDKSRSQGLLAALNAAATCWHLEAVEVILACVASIPAEFNAEDGWLSYALICAAGEFDCDDRCRWNQMPGYQQLVMQQLIAAGADVNWEHPPTGSTAFTAVLEFRELSAQAVRLLLDNGLNLDKKFRDGRTPLLGIVENHNEDVGLVRAFLEAGAKATDQDDELNTPLHIAAHRSFAELLFGHGADIFTKNRNGMTPFQTACEDGRVGVAEFLLSQGANVHEISTESQCTPLLFATGASRREGSFPRNAEEQEQIVQLLLTHGANTQVATPDGRTPLHGAARWGSVLQAKSLLEHGADVHAVTSDGETVLHAVCNVSDSRRAERTALINLLLDHGAQLEARDQNGSTPLHASWWPCNRVIYGFEPDLFNLLLTRGANPLAENKEGKTPFDLIDDKKWACDEEGMVRERSSSHTQEVTQVEEVSGSN